MPASPIRTQEPLLSRVAILAMVANGAVLALFLAQMTSVGLFTRQLGGTDFEAGVNAAVGTVAALAMRPVVGWMLDRVGRVPTLLLGLAVLAAGSLLTNWTTTIPVLYVLTGLRGAAFSFTSTATLTLATDAMPRARLAEGLSYYGLAGTLAGAVGPGLGLATATSVGFPAFWLGTAALAGLVLLMMPFVRSPHDAAIAEARRAHRALGADAPPRAPTPLRDLAKAHILLPSGLNLLQNIAYSAILTFLTLMAVDRGIPNAGLYFTVQACGAFAVRLFAARAGARYGYKTMLLLAVPLLAVGYLLLAFTQGLPLLLLAGLSYGMAIGVTQPVFSATIMSGTALGLRGKANAIYLSTSDIGLGIGSAVLGAISTGFGYTAVYLTAVGVIAVQTAAVAASRSFPGRAEAPVAPATSPTLQEEAG